MIKEIVVIEFKAKFYAQVPGILGALSLYNPDSQPLSNGQKLQGFIRGAGRDTFVQI
jgi:hypothetical protein